MKILNKTFHTVMKYRIHIFVAAFLTFTLINLIKEEYLIALLNVGLIVAVYGQAQLNKNYGRTR